jgi:hypothetical protein
LKISGRVPCFPAARHRGDHDPKLPTMRRSNRTKNLLH